MNPWRQLACLLVEAADGEVTVPREALCLEDDDISVLGEYNEVQGRNAGML